jgi:hypothetical protein
MNFISTLIPKYPDMKAAKNPAMYNIEFASKFAPKSPISVNPAPKITGIDNRKLNLAANSLSRPKSNPVDILVPEREIPGKIAIACELSLIN